MRFPITTWSDPDALSGVDRDRALAQRCSIGDLPSRSARAFGDRVALVDYSGEMTYNRLERESNRFAHVLLQLGVTAREPVAIMAPNCNAYLVAYFGIAKMGGAATLLNMLGGLSDLRYSLQTTQSRVIVCHSAVLPQLHLIASELEYVEHIIVVHADPGAGLGGLSGASFHHWRTLIDGAESWDGTDPDLPPEVPIHDRQIAQCMFSSGSTGVPKAVLTSHVGVVTAALSNAVTMGVRRSDTPDVMTVVLPLFHTVAMNVLALGMLSAGGRIHLLSGFDPEQLGKVLASSGSTHFVGLPIMLEAVLNYSRTHGESFPQLRSILYGMAALPQALDAALREHFPGVDLQMASGMTEAIPACLAQAQNTSADHSGTWGLGSPHVECRVDVAEGESTDGELLYRGPSVMEGYLIPDDTVFRGGWLHSGDLGRFDEHGQFWFLDRMKDIIKSGGENVSSISIEQVLNAHPDVVESAVIGAPDPQWGERVVAVVVLRDGVPEEEHREERAAEVMAYAAEHLRSSARPREVRFLDALPRTGNGKIRKSELRAQP